MRALVIDDSRAAAAWIRRMMREFGYETFDASNGEEGLEQLRTRSPIDLAVVDWNMPVMNGIEFVRAVRERPEYADVRLIMVTSEAEASMVAEALEAGASEYIMKPFTIDVLREKLELLGLLVA